MLLEWLEITFFFIFLLHCFPLFLLSIFHPHPPMMSNFTICRCDFSSSSVFLFLWLYFNYSHAHPFVLYAELQSTWSTISYMIFFSISPLSFVWHSEMVFFLVPLRFFYRCLQKVQRLVYCLWFSRTIISARHTWWLNSFSAFTD